MLHEVLNLTLCVFRVFTFGDDELQALLRDIVHIAEHSSYELGNPLDSDHPVTEGVCTENQDWHHTITVLDSHIDRLLSSDALLDASSVFLARSIQQSNGLDFTLLDLYRGIDGTDTDGA